MKLQQFVLLTTFLHVSSAQLNMSQYYRMPMLNRFDDYFECMGLYGNEALYCVADTFVKPDTNSEIYDAIVEFSKDTKKRFRHDNLARGLCLNKCKELVDQLGSDSDKYFVEKFPTDLRITYHAVNYYNSSHDRVAYAELINKCVNVELMDKYGLKGFSTIDYCWSENTKPPLDALDIFAAILMGSIFCVAFISSMIDRFLRNLKSSGTINHYMDPLNSETQKLLTVFSIRRNWEVLKAPAKPEFRDLRFIQGMRTLIMTIVIFGHVSIFSKFMPQQSPEQSEKSYSSPSNFIISNGFNIVQSFFVISGFLVAYLFFNRKANQKIPSLALLTNVAFMRYMRVVPVMAIAILLHSTWLYRLGMGPIFNQVNYAEQQFCREHWWKNLLLIDQITNPEQKCLIHTWYVNCDFWLFISATVYLLFIRAYPRTKYWLVIAIVFLASVLYGYTIYVNKLEPIILYTPDAFKNRALPVSINQQNYFKLVHIPVYMNIGNFFIGVGAGLLYYRLKKSGKTLPKYVWLRGLWHVCFAMIFINFMSAFIFFNYDFDKSSILMAVTAVVLKHSYGLIFAFMIFGIAHGFGWWLPNLFNYPEWQIIGKISYSAYIFHMFIVKLVLMKIYQPLMLNNFSAIVLGIGVTGLSIIVGIYFTLTVELPVVTLVNMALKKCLQPKTKTTSDDAELKNVLK